MNEDNFKQMHLHLEALSQFLKQKFAEMEKDFGTTVRCIIIVEENFDGHGKEDSVR